MKNIIDIRNRADFREWIKDNSDAEKECWIATKRGDATPSRTFLPDESF